jgi:hypothetical protein
MNRDSFNNNRFEVGSRNSIDVKTDTTPLLKPVIYVGIVMFLIALAYLWANARFVLVIGAYAYVGVVSLLLFTKGASLVGGNVGDFWERVTWSFSENRNNRVLAAGPTGFITHSKGNGIQAHVSKEVLKIEKVVGDGQPGAVPIQAGGDLPDPAFSNIIDLSRQGAQDDLDRAAFN